MTKSEIVERPVFQNLEEGSQFDQPPFSRLAYLAFAAGLFSLLSAFSTILLPAAMLAMAVGIAVVWKLSGDAPLGGRWLAQLGLALSAVAIVWSVSARAGVESYMYDEASHHAKLLLDTLSAGDKYEALELKHTESSRQLTGTNLANYYNSLGEEEKQGVQEFLNNSLTKSIITSGPGADWQFVRGVNVVNQDKQNYVTVEMVNRAGDGERVLVRMKRMLGVLSDPDKRNTTALWNFEDLSRP